YGFAKAATCRRYGVRVPDMTGRWFDRSFDRRQHEYQRLYELTTGAAALTESLQLERMLGQRRKEGPRDVDIAKVPGIDIAEHDWKKMMAAKHPDPDRLQNLFPPNNYNRTFSRFAPPTELATSPTRWATPAGPAFQARPPA